MTRKLPSVGDRVAYTRDFIMNVPQRHDWRGTIQSACSFATPDWPMVRVKWDDGCEADINAKNLCKVRSVAFVESAARPYSAIK